MDLSKYRPKLNIALSKITEARNIIIEVQSSMGINTTNSAVVDGFMTSIDSAEDDALFTIDDIQDAIEWIDEEEQDEDEDEYDDEEE